MIELLVIGSLSLGGLLAPLLVIGALLALLSYIVNGRMPRFGGGLGSRTKGTSTYGRGGGTVGGRSPLEIAFAVFAVANFVTSQSLNSLGPLLAGLMLAVIVGLAVSPSIGGLAIAGIGLVAAVADIAGTESAGVAVAVAFLALMLGWLFGAARFFGAGRGV